MSERGNGSRSRSALASRWCWTTVGELCEVTGGVTKNASKQDGKLLPYLRVANVYANELRLGDIAQIAVAASAVDRVVLKRGDLLVVEGNGSMDQVGRVAIWDGSIAPCVHQNHLIKARCYAPGLERWVLFWLLSSAGRDAVVKVASSTSGLHTLSLSKVRALPVPLAPPRVRGGTLEAIDEQLTKLDAAVAGLKRVQANLKRYRASVLKAAVEGSLVPTEAELARQDDRDNEPASVLLERILAERRRRWEESELAKMKASGKAANNETWKSKYKEPASPDTSKLPELPEGWCWTTVDQLAFVGTGATPKRGLTEYWDGGDVPWVTSSVVNQPDVSQPSDFVTQGALQHTNLTLYPPGTVLVAMYGEGKTRGKAAVLTIESTTNQALAALELVLAIEELRSWLLVVLEHNYEATRRLSSGGVQPNLNLSLVRGIAVPLPPLSRIRPLTDEVASSLSVADALADGLPTQLARWARLRQAILKWAFEGKLVDQDPNDEPASVLLDSIRENRSPSSPARRNKKRKPLKKKTASA